MHLFPVSGPWLYHATALSPTPQCQKKQRNGITNFTTISLGPESVLSTVVGAADPGLSAWWEGECSVLSAIGRIGRQEGKDDSVLPGRGH